MSRLTIDNFKNSQVKERFELLHPKMREICEDMAKYCIEQQQKFMITETVTHPSEDAKLGRVSQSHSQSRAVDLRTNHWETSFKDKFVRHFMERYNEIGAISLSDGERKFIVDKSHLPSPHLHCQLDATFAIIPELT